jgi:hypothetical protein
MGEVYRARDRKLNRDVAIKILPAMVAHDADRVARFTREAQTLAALNHPNIAQIYGIVEAPASPDTGAADLPSSVRRLLRRCLEKDPRRRLSAIGDARLELDETALPAGADAVTSPAPGTAAAGPFWRRALPWAIVGALAIALAGSMSGAFTRSTPRAPLRRFTMSVPAKFAPNWGDFRVAISSNGSTIAYNCRDGNRVSLCVKPLDSLDERPVADARDAGEWFFSPDGEWIGMADDVGLSKVSVHGGAPQVTCRWLTAQTAPKGFSWGADDYILLGTASGVRRVSAAGGATEVVTRIAEGSGVVAHKQPSHLPGGRSALVTIVRADGGETAGLIDLKNGSIRDLGIHGHGFVYIPTRGESSARLVWADRNGRPTAIPGDRLDYEHLDLAPDGRRALLNLESGSVDLIDLQSGTRKVLGSGAFPIWSPNGERVTF